MLHRINQWGQWVRCQVILQRSKNLLKNTFRKVDSSSLAPSARILSTISNLLLDFNTTLNHLTSNNIKNIWKKRSNINLIREETWANLVAKDQQVQLKGIIAGEISMIWRQSRILWFLMIKEIRKCVFKEVSRSRAGFSFWEIRIDSTSWGKVRFLGMILLKRVDILWIWVQI